MEEIIKTVETVNPIPTNIESKSINELIISEEEKTVEELLQKAKKLYEQNKSDIITNVLKTDADLNENSLESLTKDSILEVDIFKMLEPQANENKDTIPEKVSNLKSSNESNLKKNLAADTNTFPQQKNLVLNITDLRDSTKQKLPMDVLSLAEAIDEKKNLKKDVNDVETSFYNVLKQKTKESAPNLSSYDSNFNNEDFYNFLKLLQDQSNKEVNSSSQLVVDQFDPLKERCVDLNMSPDTELYNINPKEKFDELELPTNVSMSLAESKIDKMSVENLQKDFSKESSNKSSGNIKSNTPEIKKVVNDKDELYTIGLTPRLELFADTIPKLLAEKSHEANKKEEKKQEGNTESGTKLNDCEDFSFKNFKALDVYKKMGILKDHKNVTDVKDYKDLIDLKDGLNDKQNFNCQSNNELINSNDPFIIKKIIGSTENEKLNCKMVIGKSRSSDQLSKQTTKLGLSLENLPSTTKVETRKQVLSGSLPKKSQTSKNKIQPKTVVKTNSNKINLVKRKKEPVKCKLFKVKLLLIIFLFLKISLNI